MVVICSMESIVRDGKLIGEAKNAIQTMGKGDKLIIVSKTGNITVNTETLNFLTHLNCTIEVAEYASSNAMLLNIGMELARAYQLKIVMKAEDAAMLKDLLKGNEKVSFGWQDAKTKKKVAGKAAENTEEVIKPATKRSKKAEKPLEEPSSSNMPDTPIKERKIRKKKETTEEKEESEAKGPFTIEEVKKAVGGKHSKKEWELITGAMNEAASSDLELDFFLRIKTPILYQDEAFVEKVAKAYTKLKG